MKPTIGIPLGMTAGLAICSGVMAENGSLSWGWAISCVVLIGCSFVIKSVVDDWTVRIEKGEKEEEAFGNQ